MSVDLICYPISFTVPILFDKKTQAIVNNESSEIIRIFNTAFNELLPEEQAKLDIYPKVLQSEIDEVNEWVYNDLNSMLCLFQSASRGLSPIYLQTGSTERDLLALNRLTNKHTTEYSPPSIESKPSSRLSIRAAPPS